MSWPCLNLLILLKFCPYLRRMCLTIVLNIHFGKIGIVGDFADKEVSQSLLKDLAHQYILTDGQQSIKKFHAPFVYRSKETSLWKYYLTGLSYSNILVNTVIKLDLRYFKDAIVDTVIPFNYWYFHYQNTITKFLNFKHIRFHKLETLEHIFQSLTHEMWLIPSHYSVRVVYTWNCEFLRREKRLMWLLQRGKTTEVIFQPVV